MLHSSLSSYLAFCSLLLAGQSLAQDHKAAAAAAALAPHQGVAGADQVNGDVMGGIATANSTDVPDGRRDSHADSHNAAHHQGGVRGSRRRHRRAADAYQGSYAQTTKQTNWPQQQQQATGTAKHMVTQYVTSDKNTWSKNAANNGYATTTATNTQWSNGENSNWGSSGNSKSGSSKNSGSSNNGSTSNSGSSNSGSNSTSSLSNSGTLSSGSLLEINGVKLGMLPDFGYSGNGDSFSALNQMIASTGKKFAIFGEYAQVLKNEVFDGSQLLYRWDEVINSGAIFEPAVMPTGGWSGFTWDNKTQAVAVCKVMQKFVDGGVPEVRLRFAHEANYYQTDGTYPGTASDFIEGFNVVASTCKEIAPQVKMFWTPNIANLATYTAYQPDMNNVDYIGIDYYPKKGSDLSTAFVEQMKPFHDKYTNDWTQFAIGETGLGWEGTVSERMQWFNSVIQAKSSMPHLVSAAWFNYMKDYNYKLVDTSSSGTTSTFVSYLKGSS